MATAPQPPDRVPPTSLAPSLIVLLAGLALLALGACLGETETILNKATQVCLQCIGIG